MTDTDRIDALARDLPSIEPPEGFAERVVATSQGEKRARRQRTLLGAFIGADAVGLIALALTFVVSTSETGEAVASAHSTVKLGDNAAAVLEKGAAMRFEIDDGVWKDRVTVDQSSGSAFYRVEPGNELSVKTPAGEVVVHGTCFTVEVTSGDNMITQSSKPFSKTLASAVAGAILGAGLVVTVYEGEVAVRNERGEVRVHPGESATASMDSAPVIVPMQARQEIARLRHDNENLQEALVSARQALSGDPRRIADENIDLKRRLAKAEQELALLDAVRADKEGKPIEPPGELPPRFAEQALVKAFNEALAQAGLKGDVSHIDCAEYPCIVYGDIQMASDQDAMNIGEKLKQMPAMAPYADDSDHSSFWRMRDKDKKTGEVIDETRFGVALYPKNDEEDPARNEAITKRIGHRNNEMWEALRPRREN